MTIDEIDRLFSRLRRLSDSLNVKGGTGTTWNYTFPDGQTHTYNFTNVRPVEQIEDDIANMFIWSWNLKDHLKLLCPSRQIDPNSIEAAINASDTLKICGDIANLLKHGKLDRSRSDRFPTLHRPQIEIPQAAIGSLIFMPLAVTTNVSRPELVEVSVAVYDQAGDQIGDAFALLRDAIAQWEDIRNRVIDPAPPAHNTANNDAGKSHA